MKVTPFGEAARLMRMRLGQKLKNMADHMSISSSHLSGIEYGEKTLSDLHVARAIQFFQAHGADDEELKALKRAAAKSQAEVQVGNLSHGQRHLVAVFARQLAAGLKPTNPMLQFLDTKTEGDL